MVCSVGTKLYGQRIWPLVPLGKLARISGGFTPKSITNASRNGGIPWVTPSDLTVPGSSILDIRETEHYITRKELQPSAAHYILPPSTVLFSSLATGGKIGIARVSLVSSQDFANFTPNAQVEPRYLAYAIRQFTTRLIALSGSRVLKEASRGGLGRFQIPLPTSSEQRRIIEILDQADGIQRTQDEVEKKVKHTLPALFLKAFGDPATNPYGLESGNTWRADF